MRRVAGTLALALALALSLAAGAAGAPSLEPYRGLGTWIDIYDDAQLKAPEATVDRIQARGVRTIYLETANFKQSRDVVRADRLSRLLDAAHARGIAVVAWYLPSFQAGGASSFGASGASTPRSLGLTPVRRPPAAAGTVLLIPCLRS